jgi:predicted transcriptional regulator
MMRTNKPTKAELEILDILWEKKRATVREIHETVERQRPTAYTTVLKLMQIMHDKGLVKRDESAKAHVYQPAYSRKQTQKSLVGDLLHKAFSGSALMLVQHVLETTPSSPEELAEIRKLIAEAEARGGRK